MTEPSEKTEEVLPRRRPVWPWVLLLALLGTGAFVGWRVLQQPRGPEESPVLVVDAGAPVEVDAGVAHSVDDGDTVLKTLAAGWSSDPQFVKWLEQLSLRHLVAAVQLVAEGSSPRPALPFLSIAGPFEVREERSLVFIAPSSYARYDALMSVAGSVNVAAAGDAYAQLRPFFDAAFAEIGRPGAHFDDVLTAALRRWGSVPLQQGAVELVAKGVGYQFKEPSLEALSPAEKQVLRMGPTNGQTLQRQLREFASHAKLTLGP